MPASRDMTVGMLVMPLTHFHASCRVMRMLTDWQYRELRMTKNQVKKEVSEEEIKDPYGGPMGCFLMFFAALFGLYLCFPVFLKVCFHLIRYRHWACALDPHQFPSPGYAYPYRLA